MVSPFHFSGGSSDCHGTGLHPGVTPGCLAGAKGVEQYKFTHRGLFSLRCPVKKDFLSSGRYIII